MQKKAQSIDELEQEVRRLRRRVAELEAQGTDELVDERTREMESVLTALRTSERRYRILFNGMDDALLVHDLDGNILDCNDVQCQQLGYTREELLTMNVSDIDAPEFADGFKERLSSQLEEGRHRCEGIHLTRDGHRIPVDISSSAMRYLDQDAVLSVSRDISDHKHAEAERQALEEQIRHTHKLESLGLMAGSIAHDFNNLLVGVMGHSELAQIQLEPDHPAHKELAGILIAAERAAELCNQMLAYSGKGKFVVQTLDINHTVLDISKLISASLNKKISLVFDLTEALPAIKGDSAQITQLVLNLLTNAAEAIGEKKGCITIRSKQKQCDQAELLHVLHNEHLKPGTYVCLSVEDSGCGMDEVTLHRIFDPFFTTKFTGRGLGLAAVIGIIRGHHGGLQVHSEPGKGTRFEVYLPASRQRAKKPHTAVQQILDWTSSETILLVDDETAVLNVAQRMLERKGFRVVTATNGREAIDLYRAQHDQIKGVVLDLTMPELNGKETYRELRKINPQVRVLLSSGYSSEEVTREFQGRRQVDFVQKPYQARIFYEKIQAMLGQ